MAVRFEREGAVAHPPESGDHREDVTTGPNRAAEVPGNFRFPGGAWPVTNWNLGDDEFRFNRPDLHLNVPTEATVA